MHRRMCSGSISLRAAQDAFHGNRTVAYRLRTSRGLPPTETGIK